jgi:hypothetical protein
MLPLSVDLIFVISFNLIWLVGDVLLIRRGFIDKTYAVPVVALAVNTAWDLYGSIIHPSPFKQSYVNLIFLVVDLVILGQMIVFWQSDSQNMTRWGFYFFVAFSMILGLILYLAVTIELQDFVGAKMAFIDNFINSALFISMFLSRPDLRGQSLYIALLKMIGTGCASIAFYFYPWPGYEHSALLPVLYVSIVTLDLIYVVLVYHRSRTLGINPWRRF